MPQNICFCGVSGKLQPFARYETYNRDFNTAAVLSTTAGPIFTEGTDIGVNYVISGYNARTTVAWGQRDAVGGESFSLLRTGFSYSSNQVEYEGKCLALAHGPESNPAEVPG